MMPTLMVVETSSNTLCEFQAGTQHLIREVRYNRDNIPHNTFCNGALKVHAARLHLVGITGIMNRFDVQPLGRFAGSSAAIRRPKVSFEPATAGMAELKPL